MSCLFYSGQVMRQRPLDVGGSDGKAPRDRICARAYRRLSSVLVEVRCHTGSSSPACATFSTSARYTGPGNRFNSLRAWRRRTPSVRARRTPGRGRVLSSSPHTRRENPAQSEVGPYLSTPRVRQFERAMPCVQGHSPVTTGTGPRLLRRTLRRRAGR